MDLQTLGFAAATYQRDPRLFETAILVVQAERAYAAGEPIPHAAQPAMILNGKRYFATDEIVGAIAWIAKSEAEKATEKASRAANE